MRFKQKKLNKVINSKNKQISQWAQYLDSLSEEKNIPINELSFEYLKSILIQYIENDYFIIMVDVFVRILTYSMMAFLTVYISFLMTGIQSFDEEHIVSAFIILLILNIISYLLGNNISSNHIGLDTRDLKSFNYILYCYTKENILKNDQLEGQ